MPQHYRWPTLILSLMLVASCSSWLPSSREEQLSPFDTYSDAVQRFDMAKVQQSRRRDLIKLGFDPLSQGNGRMLSFIDLRLMFIQPNVPIEYLPDGMLACLEAKDRCSGFSFSFGRVEKERVGSFWADVFNFRKKRQINGWSFSAVFVMVDDVLVHKVSNGEPNIRRYESKKHPLGPLQDAGDFISDQL
ncbi:hypothetical protein [Atopomonas sediminilitoris]|uniref:hypothetical protein n=1 Tax=Atopomonas sediminilitoris TaxID=2919919 RepID=UPI001F4E1C70|nr:hypothetical protein [Atopomonas sediminilitoris]MCJ8168585.1 hypothetical protein [Atopomonas sediminilitoris]